MSEYFDPQEPDPSAATGAPPQGAPGGGLADQWRGFLAEPSNRAFLIQTGLAMMQPRGTGQTAVGAFANSIGEGGEAAARVQGNEEKSKLNESLIRSRDDTSDSRLMRADAAIRNADTKALLGERGVTPSSLLNAQVRGQTALNRWLQSQDLLGNDPYLAHLGEKSKADVLRKMEEDPTYKRRVLELFTTKEALGASPGKTAPVPSATATPSPYSMDTDTAQAKAALAQTNDPAKRQRIIDIYKSRGGNPSDLQ